MHVLAAQEEKSSTVLRGSSRACLKTRRAIDRISRPKLKLWPQFWPQSKSLRKRGSYYYISFLLLLLLFFFLSFFFPMGFCIDCPCEGVGSHPTFAVHQSSQPPREQEQMHVILPRHRRRRVTRWLLRKLRHSPKPMRQSTLRSFHPSTHLSRKDQTSKQLNKQTNERTNSDYLSLRSIFPLASGVCSVHRRVLSSLSPAD